MVKHAIDDSLNTFKIFFMFLLSFEIFISRYMKVHSVIVPGYNCNPTVSPWFPALCLE